MYVCICNSVTDRAIHQSVKAGYDSYQKICSQLNTASCCGRCQHHVREVIEDAKDKYQHNSPTAIPIFMQQRIAA